MYTIMVVPDAVILMMTDGGNIMAMKLQNVFHGVNIYPVPHGMNKHFLIP